MGEQHSQVCASAHTLQPMISTLSKPYQDMTPSGIVLSLNPEALFPANSFFG